VISVDSSMLPVPDEYANARAVGWQEGQWMKPTLRRFAWSPWPARAVSGRSVYAIWRLISGVARAASGSFSLIRFLAYRTSVCPWRRFGLDNAAIRGAQIRASRRKSYQVNGIAPKAWQTLASRESGYDFIRTRLRDSGNGIQFFASIGQFS
jgi:hypothetical protein